MKKVYSRTSVDYNLLPITSVGFGDKLIEKVPIEMPRRRRPENRIFLHLIPRPAAAITISILETIVQGTFFDVDVLHGSRHVAPVLLELMQLRYDAATCRP